MENTNKPICPECGSRFFIWSTCRKCGWDAFDNHSKEFLKNLKEIMKK